jgi:hypothetical protein
MVTFLGKKIYFFDLTFFWFMRLTLYSNIVFVVDEKYPQKFIGMITSSIKILEQGKTLSPLDDQEKLHLKPRS